MSWGWFQGGFAPTTAATGDHARRRACPATRTPPAPPSWTTPRTTSRSSTTPPPPTRTTWHRPRDAEIGHNGQANHQYDLTDFNKVVNTDNMPAVSFLKAGMYQDGHAAYSDPIDEQKFITNTVNADPEVQELGKHRRGARL